MIIVTVNIIRKNQITNIWGNCEQLVVELKIFYRKFDFVNYNWQIKQRKCLGNGDHTEFMFLQDTCLLF